jgi:hypothetical protein
MQLATIQVSWQRTCGAKSPPVLLLFYFVKHNESEFDVWNVSVPLLAARAV